jgi:hypothetical protein
MRLIAEHCTGEEAHRQIRSHTLAHLNAALSGNALTQANTRLRKSGAA